MSSWLDWRIATIVLAYTFFPFVYLAFTQETLITTINTLVVGPMFGTALPNPYQNYALSFLYVLPFALASVYIVHFIGRFRVGRRR